jgi:putative PEP-CTERM system histidine kinase
LVSTLIDVRVKETDRLFSYGIVRVLVVLPFLAGSYILTYFLFDFYDGPFFFNFENILSLLCLVLGYRMYSLATPTDKRILPFRFLFCLGSIVVMAAAGFVYVNPIISRVVDGELVFSYYGIIYCSALFLILSVLLFGWRLEAFWRALDAGEKWRHKYIVLGFALICLISIWSSSYRLAYLKLPHDHFLLLGIVFIAAMLLIIYALAKHRLLNRKLFVSRKVVYATITPVIFSGFFIIVGCMSMLSRLYGWPIPYVLRWLIIFLGVLSISLFALSREVRRRVKHFISTNFYVNKYEYRDEWLAFSSLLKDKLTEEGVIGAMYQILRESLYTNNILIWFGNIKEGFRLVKSHDDSDIEDDTIIYGNDPIVYYLHNEPYLYTQEGDSHPLRNSVLTERDDFLQRHEIVLMVPLILGGQCAGLIGLGAETSGGRYGNDDFDLLLALSSHATSALLAVQNAEKLARAREQYAFSNLSTFVLHDIKNAATILDLVRSNAYENMGNPDFQQDMLKSIEDALKRMQKVQDRLSSIKGKIVPVLRLVELGELLRSCTEKFLKNLSDLDVQLECPPKLLFQTDPDFLVQIIENLLINTLESGGSVVIIRIQATQHSMLRIDVLDNGPGIHGDMLPWTLFEPFKTTKPNGSGIGLWQVRQLVEILDGNIKVRNTPEGGACFTLRFKYISKII